MADMRGAGEMPDVQLYNLILVAAVKAGPSPAALDVYCRCAPADLALHLQGQDFVNVKSCSQCWALGSCKKAVSGTIVEDLAEHLQLG